MTQFLFVTDLDNTLVGDDVALAALNERLQEHRTTYGTKIVYSTGRSLVSYQNLRSQKSLLSPDAVITGVGTAIYYREDSHSEDSSEPDPTWSKLLSQQWDRDLVVAIAAHFADLTPQDATEQSQFKVSYHLSESAALEVLPKLKAKLEGEGLHINIIYSGSKDLDILPRNANKGMAMTYVRQRWQFEPSQTVVCGDSGNDAALFSVGEERGIIVANALPELLQWHKNNLFPHHYLAAAPYAGGILEGLYHFNFLSS